MRVLHILSITIILFILGVSGCSDEKGKTSGELNQEAIRLLQDRQPGQALKSVQTAINKAEADFGNDAPEIVPSLEILALIYQALGDPLNAEASYQRALKIVNKAKGPESDDTAKLLNSLGGLYYSQNRHEKAAESFKRALTIIESRFPSDDQRIGTLRKNIQTCENMLKGENTIPPATAADNAAAEVPAGTDQMQNQAQDLVPEQVKRSMTDQLAKQNIFISGLSPRLPVKMGDKGVVFPYHGIRKDKDGGSQEVMVLFAAISNPEKSGAVVFQQCRVISYRSFVNTLEQGGVAQLTKELKEVFPDLFS